MLANKMSTMASVKVGIINKPTHDFLFWKLKSMYYERLRFMQVFNYFNLTL